ncbi:MAG: PhzF family phenazine biosynthesis protein [Tahibacter sp.]
MALHFKLVDVFSRTPYGGNSLCVFTAADGLNAAQMLRITQEMRHFESIFLQARSSDDVISARVFDLREELPFAGHPIIGAAAVLHHASAQTGERMQKFALRDKTVSVITERAGRGYYGLLDQGTPEFLGMTDDRQAWARAFNLDVADLDPGLPLAVVSTGLRYLVVPVAAGALARARIALDISEALRGVGAQFAVLLDEAALEVRHWNNDGIVEDVATGSAAGVIGAYRLQHGRARGGETFVLQQGRFTGRASTLRVQPHGATGHITTVKVGGDVALVGRGTLDVLPQ